MEFTVTVDAPPAANLARIDEALRELDPAALVDAAPNGLRIAGTFDIPTLMAALRTAGFDVPERNIERLPSVCCGGCGG